MTVAGDAWGALVAGPDCLRAATGSGPLDGIRLAVKDLFDISGAVTGGGNPDWAQGRPPAARDAWAVAALRSAGATVVGKTVTDELAFSLEGSNDFHGTPRNPRAPGRLAGGSSSGSAVAVAAGLADLALGTDTGGSVRVPASFCGVHGFRPTHGRVPLDGVLPFAPSYDTVGWFARDGALLRQAGECLLAQPAPPRPLQLLVATDAFELADPACAQALLACASQLAAAGEVRAFDGDWRDWATAYSILQGLEIQQSLGGWIAQARPRFGPAIASRFEGALALDPAEGREWGRWRQQQLRRLRAALAPGVAWIVPSAPCVALPVGTGEAQLGDFYQRALALGSIAGHGGLPQLSLPLAQVHGLPLGLSLIAGPGQDESLLALAASPGRQALR